MTEEQNKNANNGQTAATNANTQANQPATPEVTTDIPLGCAIPILAVLILFVIAVFVHSCGGGNSSKPNNIFAEQVVTQQHVIKSPTGDVTVLLVSRNANVKCAGYDNSRSETYNFFTAQDIAQEFVKDTLKSPTSAHFGYDGVVSDNVTQRKDGVYVVKGWVDAQMNSGATSHLNYVVSLKYDGKGNWLLADDLAFFQ